MSGKRAKQLLKEIKKQTGLDEISPNKWRDIKTKYSHHLIDKNLKER